MLQPPRRSHSFGIVLLLLPLLAPAQSITSAPLPVAGIPVNNPFALAALIAVVGISGWYLLRRRSRLPQRLVSLLLMVLAVGGVVKSPQLWAQMLATFTNPAGETLSIPVNPITNPGFTGFQPADFANASGSSLKISKLTEPNFSQCFASQAASTLQPSGATGSSPNPACAVGQALPNGTSCRVDVDAICRGLAASTATLASVSPSAGTAAGGVGITLIGTNLTGATSISFGGVPATSVNVVNATNLTAVTPAHAVGAVDVVVTTSGGDVTLASGYTYLTTAVGQESGGGVIAALNGGLQNLIAAKADNGTPVQWAKLWTSTSAASVLDGASNTSKILSSLGATGPYAAQVCSDYQVDSQGNNPCESGNACYDDWFLPARNQLDVLFQNRVAIGGFNSAGYWSSTEYSTMPDELAIVEDFVSGFIGHDNKLVSYRARCVRNFTP